MSPESVYQGFVRQRRFLVGISLALAAAGYLGLSIKTVSVLGNAVEVAHPERVAGFAYIVWLWAIWRYVQWFVDCGAWQDTQQGFASTLERMLQLAMRSRAPAIPTGAQVEIEGLATRFFKQHNVAAQPRLTYEAVPECTKHLDGKPVSMTFLLTGHIREGEHISTVFGPVRMQVDIPTGVLRTRRVLAWLLVPLGRRYFSEYFAPFVIALFPLLPLIVPRIAAATTNI